MLVYLAALWQLLVNTVYTRCGRLLELSSLLSGSLLQRLFISRLCLLCFIAVLYFCVCFVFYVCILSLPCGVINNNNNNNNECWTFLLPDITETLNLTLTVILTLILTLTLLTPLLTVTLNERSSGGDAPVSERRIVYGDCPFSVIADSECCPSNMLLARP